MNITDEDIEVLVKRLRAKAGSCSIPEAKTAIVVVLNAMTEWLWELREAGKARSEELVHQILGTDR